MNSDQRQRDGYDRAIKTLLDVAQRTGSPAAKWAAELLIADPDLVAPCWTCTCNYLNRGLVCTHCGEPYEVPKTDTKENTMTPAEHPDGTAYPYVQGLDGVWHLRPADDQWTRDADEQARVRCPVGAVASVHVAQFPPEDLQEMCMPCAITCLPSEADVTGAATTGKATI